MKFILNLLLLLIINIQSNFSFANTYPSSSSNFFEQRYRGWLWFEEQEIQQNNKKKQEKIEQELKQDLLKKQARQEVERFAKELEDLRYLMIRYPKSVEHMLAYKQKEKIMIDNAIALGETTRLTNFLNPELVDHIKNPINLYGRRIKEDMEKKSHHFEIADLASKAELFLFFAGSCDYCKQLEPVLNDFAIKYKFKIEAVSLDAAQSKYFKTHHNLNLANQLLKSGQLEKVPTVFVVTNDGKERFELLRGAASLSEIEEMALLASKHLKNLEQSRLKPSNTLSYGDANESY